MISTQFQSLGGGEYRRSVSIGGGSHFRRLLQVQGTAQHASSINLKSRAFSKSSEIALPLSPIPPLHSLSSSSPRPWLLYPSSYFNHLDQNKDLLNHYPYCFVSHSENQIFRLDETQISSQRLLPWDRQFFFPNGTEFLGSSPLGWLLMKNPNSLQFFLTNPLFPSDSVVSLPPLLDTDFVAGSISKSLAWSDSLVGKYIYWKKSAIVHHRFNSREERHRHTVEVDHTVCLKSFAMSSLPLDPEFTVMLVQYCDILQFWKPGHKWWTRVKLHNVSSNVRYKSMVYSNTSQCFYVLSEWRGGSDDIEAWKWDSGYPQPRRTLNLHVGRVECKTYWDCYDDGQHRVKQTCLVESSSGELLLVKILRNQMSDAEDANSLRFFVFKLNFDERKWERVKSLGEERAALFVSRNSAFCVRVGNYPELRPNCIYFAINDEAGTYPLSLEMMLVLNMEDDTINRYCFASYDHQLSRGVRLSRSDFPSVWLLPNPKF